MSSLEAALVSKVKDVVDGVEKAVESTITKVENNFGGNEVKSTKISVANLELKQVGTYISK